jgi:hypothetical protein
MNSSVTDKDIIGGQGKDADLHPGNVMFRKLVNAHKQTYAQAPNADKRKISKGIVIALRRFGFKFSKLDKKSGCYDDIGDKKAVEKTSQALREKRSNKSDSNSSSYVTSSNTSSEESCVNFSIHLLQSLSGEELASPSQQEAQENHDIDMPRLPLPRPALLPNRSISGGELRAYARRMGVSDNEVSATLSALFGDINEMNESELILTPEQAMDVSQEWRFDFLSGLDRFSSMSLDDNGNADAV